MITRKFKNRYLFFYLIILIIISTYINLHWAERELLEYSNFIINHETSLFIILILFQSLTLLALLVLETLVIFFTVRIVLKKERYLRDYFKPVLTAMVIANTINLCIALFYLPTIHDVDAVYQLTLSSPVNYIVKPFVICYLLFEKEIISKNILDWVIVGGIYIIIMYIPGFIFVSFL